MAKTKTSAAVKNRYAAKAYDSLRIVVPKGRKADIDAYAKRAGTTTNGLVNALLQGELHMTEEDWKARSVEDQEDESEK